MIDWGHQFPTFVRWGQRLARSPVLRSRFLRIPGDLWHEVERCCVIEVGRGVRRVTLWQTQGDDCHAVAVQERPATNREAISVGLEEDLLEVGAHRVKCTLLLNPPWSAAKVFPMNSAEADNPDRWILQHRKEVFPPGIEDDTMLAYQALPASGGQSSLAVGLTRRSTIVQLQASIVRVGCWLDQVVLGPLHMLEASIIRATSGCDFIIDRAGVGSIGCWFFQQGAIQGWAEISVTGSERSDAQIPVESLIRVFGSRIYIEEETPRIIEAPAFVPSVKVRPKSRWLLPTIPPHRRSFASIQWTADSTPQVFERWSAWVFRWAVVLAVAVLALGLAGHSLSVAVTALRGGSAAEFATVSAKFDQLTIERNRLLSKLAQLSALGVARSASGRFWFDLGVTKPEQVWLRSVKLQAGNARQTGALWQLEGLSLDRTSPDKFATVLAHRSHLVARVTHLERVDPSKLREVPHSLNREFYRFAIEVSQ